MHNPVGWFEIPATDLDRAQAFYQNVFQITLERHSMGPNEMAWFPMQEHAKGATGSLIKSENHRPSSDGTVVYFTAPNIDETVTRIEEHGGKILMPKTDIGEYGFIVTFQDSEGNKVALHRRKDA